MGKFQLNKEGEDPIKIYEDIFKIAEGTVETHLDKLGRMPKPISESKASEYDSMGMWDEMEVWWNSLPTSEQRDIIAKRGEGWELDRIDENGWETAPQAQTGNLGVGSFNSNARIVRARIV